MLARSGLIAAALLAQAQAHMQLYNPPPFMAYNNPHTPKGKEDDELLFPYDCCGEKTVYPCRGYLNLLGTPAGASVASWAAGSTQHMEMVGPAPLGGNHYGGSCQVSFSVDKGKTFRVAKSWEGDCPLRNNGEHDPSKQDFPFTVPSDLPTGDAVFAWTWINREREFFMNCAAVSILPNTTVAASGAASASASASKPASSLASRVSSAASRASSAFSKASSASVSNLKAIVPSASSTKPNLVATRASTSAPAATSSLPLFSYDMDGCICTCPILNPDQPGGQATLQNCNCVCETVPDITKTTGLPIQTDGPDSDDDDDDSAASSTSSSSRHRRSTRNRLAARATPTPSKVPFVPFSQRPLVFVGNINGCMTPKTNWELKYPNPGPDVQLGDGEYDLRLPTGTC